MYSRIIPSLIYSFDKQLLRAFQNKNKIYTFDSTSSSFKIYSLIILTNVWQNMVVSLFTAALFEIAKNYKWSIGGSEVKLN